MGEIKYKYSIGDAVILLNGEDIEDELERSGIERDNCNIEFEDGDTWHVMEEWIEPIQQFDQSNPELDDLFEV